MLYDLTEKLKFEEDPVLKLKDGVEVTVITDAEVVLKVMNVKAGNEMEMFANITELLFSKEDKEKIKKLKLKVKDYGTVVKTAIALAIGNDPDEVNNSGEAEAHTTT